MSGRAGVRGLLAVLIVLAEPGICRATTGVTTTLLWQDTEPVPSYRIYRSTVGAADWKQLVELEALRVCEIVNTKVEGHCHPILDCKFDVPDDEHDYRVCRIRNGIAIDCDAPLRPTVVCGDQNGRPYLPGADVGIADGFLPGPPSGVCP